MLCSHHQINSLVLASSSLIIAKRLELRYKNRNANNETKIENELKKTQ